jgi:hypothetical protein
MATDTAKPYTSNATPPMAIGRSELHVLAIQKTSGFTGGPSSTVLINVYSLKSEILMERIIMFSFLLLSHSLSFSKSLYHEL